MSGTSPSARSVMSSSGRGTADADRMVWRSVWLSKPGLLIVLEHATRLVPAAHRPTRVGVGPSLTPCRTPLRARVTGLISSDGGRLPDRAAPFRCRRIAGSRAH